MNCPKCNAEIDDNAFRCFYCGKILREQPELSYDVTPKAKEGGKSHGGLIFFIIILLILVVVVIVVVTRQHPSPPLISESSSSHQTNQNLTSLAYAYASSSCPPSQRYQCTYYPGNAVDGDPTTAWIEGASNSAGIGQWIALDFRQSVEVYNIRVLPGYNKYANDAIGDRWRMNFRVRMMRIEFDDGTSVIKEFNDERRFQEIPIYGKQTRRIKFIILSVYTDGATGYDTAISEIEVLGKRL